MSVWVGLHLHESGGWAGSCLVGLCPVVLDFVQSGRAMSGWYGSPTTNDSVIVEDPVLVDKLVTVVDKKACRGWHRGTVGGGDMLLGRQEC